MSLSCLLVFSIYAWPNARTIPQVAVYTLAAVKRRQRVCWNEPARLVFFYITVITRQLLDLWCPLKHKHANCLPKSVSSFVITEAESFNNLAHCQRVRQHKCARKRRERKRAASVVVYNMFSCWLKNNTNPWTAEFFFLCLCITLRSYRNNTSVRLHIQVYQYAPDEKDLKDFLFGSGFWVNVVFADGTT